jgi:hypothetical protein
MLSIRHFRSSISVKSHPTARYRTAPNSGLILFPLFVAFKLEAPLVLKCQQPAAWAVPVCADAPIQRQDFEGHEVLATAATVFAPVVAAPLAVRLEITDELLDDLPEMFVNAMLFVPQRHAFLHFTLSGLVEILVLPISDSTSHLFSPIGVYDII